MWRIGRHAKYTLYWLYSDTLLFHFQSSSIPSFQLTGEKEEGTAALLWAWTLVRGWGQGRGTSASVSAAAAALALIRDWPSKPVSCIVHQKRSASQPESQMIPSTCKAFFKKKKKYFQPPLSHIILLHLLHTCKSYITCVTNLRDTLFHWEYWEKNILWVPF